MRFPKGLSDHIESAAALGVFPGSTATRGSRSLNRDLHTGVQDIMWSMSVFVAVTVHTGNLSTYCKWFQRTSDASDYL
jgi:hypothetical protein